MADEKNVSHPAPTDRVKARVDRATVTVRALGDKGTGQGVLVPGRMIVTAAHVLDWNTTGYMEDDHTGLTTITTADGRQILVVPHAVEPVADIAVLGEVDGQQGHLFDEASEAFTEFCDTTRPVHLCTTVFKLRECRPGHVLTHDQGWLPATVEQPGHVRWLVLHPERPINAGTSGGPVVTEDGLLLGTVTKTGWSPSGDHSGSVPRASMTLPAWVLRVIRHPTRGLYVPLLDLTPPNEDIDNA